MKTNFDKYLVFLFALIFSISMNSQSSNNQNCFISIKDYGAKMDGVADDSDAIMSSLDALNYAFIPTTENGVRIDKTILLRGNQNIFGLSRGSIIKSYVPAGSFAIKAHDVGFTQSVLIKDLTIDVQSSKSNGIQAYETRNVYIDNIAILGNRICDIGVQFNGGGDKGTAWNQLNRYTIFRCNVGIDLNTDNDEGWSNRSYIGFGVTQTCNIGVRLYKANTNTILTCPQGCPTGFKIEKSKFNTISTIVENSVKNSFLIEKGSNFNTINGQFNADNYSDKGKGNAVDLNRKNNAIKY